MNEIYICNENAIMVRSYHERFIDRSCTEDLEQDILPREALLIIERFL